jgi:hypothetical protein
MIRSTLWTCPNCAAVGRFPAESPAIHCICGLVYHRAGDRVDLSHMHAVEQRPPQPPPHGPGTELRKILGRCNCGYAWQLDEWGPDGCLEHIDQIIQWMQRDSEKQSSAISEEAARRMVLLAIERAKAADAVDG